MIKPPKPLNERRYIVGYDPSGEVVEEGKTIVFVVDKWSHKIVYKSITRDRKKAYPSIQRIYDKDECIPPQPLRLLLFE